MGFDPLSLALIGTTVAGVGGSMYSANKASKTMDQAAKASQIDIDKVDQKTRAIARQNAFESADLERLLTPEVPELRTAANRAVIAGLNDNSTDSLRSTLQAKLGTSLETPLLKEAIAKARSDLALGGTLSQDVQNAATRRGLATAGSVGGGGLGLGRDVVARDLGLTSQGLEQSRLATALGAGQAEQSLATNNASNLLNTVQVMNALDQSKKNYALSAAGYGESIAQPIVGLDPASIANMYAGNATNMSAALSNKAALYGQQGQGFMNASGQMGGLALLNYIK